MRFRRLGAGLPVCAPLIDVVLLGAVTVHMVRGHHILAPRAGCALRRLLRNLGTSHSGLGGHTLRPPLRQRILATQADREAVHQAVLV